MGKKYLFSNIFDFFMNNFIYLDTGNEEFLPGVKIIEDYFIPVNTLEKNTFNVEKPEDCLDQCRVR